MDLNWIWISGGVAVAAALVLIVWWVWLRKKKVVGGGEEAAIESTDHGLHAPLPPSRTPGRSDKIVAVLINNLNADMRSLEIGRWFFKRLRAQVMTKNSVKCGGGNYSDFNLEAIAAAVPGANDVTMGVTVKALRALVDEVRVSHCSGAAGAKTVSRDAFMQTLDDFEASALAPGRGVLLGMNGYALKSRLPLPN